MVIEKLQVMYFYIRMSSAAMNLHLGKFLLPLRKNKSEQLGKTISEKIEEQKKKGQAVLKRKKTF